MPSSTQKIKMLLAYKGLSSADLARLLETTPQNLSQALKRDNFSQDTLDKIATILLIILVLVMCKYYLLYYKEL